MNSPFCWNRVALCLLYTVCLTVRVTKSSIVTKPTNELVLVGNQVSLHCCTDLPYLMHWHWTPSNAKDPIELYFGHIHPNWTTSVRVDTNVPGCFHLTIDRVEKRHAGKYECYDNEGYNYVKASAELNVIDAMPRCEHTVDVNKTMISCHFTMSGNLEPHLNCSFHHHPSTQVDSWSVIKNGTDITVLDEIQLSTTQRDLDANFTCAIVVDGGSGISPVLTPLDRNEDVPRYHCDPIWIALTVISSVIIVIIVIIFIVFKRKYRKSKSITDRTPPPEQHALLQIPNNCDSVQQ